MSLNVKYAPDYNAIVEHRLDIITGNDPELAQTALSEIKLAGPGILPTLKRKLAEACKAAKLATVLETLLREFEQNQLE